MGETLTEQRRVKEEVIRYVNFCHRGRTVDIGNDIQVTVLYKKATANYVPAAAVIRRWRALSGIIGRKTIWRITDAQSRKRGEQIGLDTLVVHAVNDEY